MQVTQKEGFTEIRLPQDRMVMLNIGSIAKCLHRNGYHVDAWAWGEMHVIPQITEEKLRQLLGWTK